LDGKGLSYGWDSEITALSHDADAPWFRFRTTLHLSAPVKLRQDSRIEPQIITWLSSSSTLMEGQSGSWRRVFAGTAHAKLPGHPRQRSSAVYLLDQSIGAETVMYFDVGDMAWMSTENLPRFWFIAAPAFHASNAKAPAPRRGVAGRSGYGQCAAGGRRQLHLLPTTTAHESLADGTGVRSAMDASSASPVRRKTYLPACAASWKEFAAGTVEDLQDKSAAQIETKGYTGLRAYVKASSQLWNDSPDNFELMTVADVLWPSLLYLRLHPFVEFRTGMQRSSHGSSCFLPLGHAQHWQRFQAFTG